MHPQDHSSSTRRAVKKDSLVAVVTLGVLLPAAAWCQPQAVLATWDTQGSGGEQFDNPEDVTVDGSRRVYVADMINHRIQVFTSDSTHPTHSLVL